MPYYSLHPRQCPDRTVNLLIRLCKLPADASAVPSHIRKGAATDRVDGCRLQGVRLRFTALRLSPSALVDRQSEPFPTRLYSNILILAFKEKEAEGNKRASLCRFLEKNDKQIQPANLCRLKAVCRGYLSGCHPPPFFGKKNRRTNLRIAPMT